MPSSLNLRCKVKQLTDEQLGLHRLPELAAAMSRQEPEYARLQARPQKCMSQQQCRPTAVMSCCKARGS